MRRTLSVTCAVCAAMLTGEVYAQTPRSEVTIAIEGSYRYIRANGIADHTVGRFPSRNNPNTIAPQQYAFRVPSHPKVARQTTPLGLWPFGIAVNGVPFDPGAAEFWRRDPRSGWQYEALSGKINLGLDQNNAHVQPGGAYDGSFVQDYEYVEGLGDLDACNGRFGTTPEYPDGTYHYFITPPFPSSPGCSAGRPM